MAMRRGIPRRVDANHAEIVAALKAAGCAVMDLSAEGRGVPDILVSDRRQRLHLMEIKVGKAKLNKRQQRWHDDWHGGTVWVLRTVEDVEMLNRLATARHAHMQKPARSEQGGR